MAYTHTQYQVMFPSGITATASGDKADWAPGYQPHYVRAAGVIFTISGSTTSGAVLAFLHNSLASGSTASDLAVLTLTSGTTSGGAGTGLSTAALTAGNVIYKDGLNVKVSPGETVTFNVRAAVTGVCATRAFLMVEPSWSNPLNSTTMFSTT